MRDEVRWKNQSKNQSEIENLKDEVRWKNQDKENDKLDDTIETIIIPNDERDLGTFITFMRWTDITNSDSPQNAPREDAIAKGIVSFSNPEYFSLIDGRILIATLENIGGDFNVQIGDYVDVTFQSSDGAITIYECIIGETKDKNNENTNSWGHEFGRYVVEILYYNRNIPEGYNKSINDPWRQGRVASIGQVGSFYD